MRRLMRGETARGLTGRLIGLYLSLALRSTRWTIEVPLESWPLLTAADGRAAIIAFWHEFLPLMPALWMRAHACNPRLGIAVLISRHRDGRMITDIVGRWGIEVVSGSSARTRPGGRDKGGATAVRALLDTLRDGRMVAITPDGPRGPRRTAQPGVARLAALSGAPVIACACSTGNARRLRSWDRMMLPLPFARGRIVCSAPITVPQQDRPAAETAIVAALDRVARKAGA